MQLTEQQQQLVAENHNLIYFVLRKNGWSIDEYYGSAAIGLCKAAYKFDAGRGVRFSTYATLLIKNEVLSEIRKEQAKKRSGYIEVPLDENIPDNKSGDPLEILIQKEEISELSK